MLRFRLHLAGVLSLGFCLAAYDATGSVDVRMSGTVSYAIDGGSATIEVERITNHGSTRSGTLYLTVWFTSSPDPYTPGHLVARASLAALGGNGTLHPGYYYGNVGLTTDYEPPPDGTYYAHVYVSQYPNLNTVLDLVTFTETFSQGPNVDIVGTASYEINGDLVTLGAEWIANRSDTDTTGTLHVTLWLTEGSDPYTEGHRAARASLVELDGEGRLPPGYYYYDVEITTDYDPPPPGTYYVHLFVSQYPNLNVALDLVTFTNKLVVEDDHGDEPFNATVVTVGSFTDGRLEVGGDVDMFRVNLVQAGTLEATTHGSTDTVGILVGEDDEVVRVDDDSGDGLNFHLEAHVEPGAWYLAVLGYDETTTGSYDLAVRFSPDRTEPAPNAPSRHFGDFDGDGRDDVLLRHADGRWHYYPMNGRNVTGGGGSVDLTNDLDYRVVGIGDFNGDGRDDVLLRHGEDGTWQYYPMNGRDYIEEEAGNANLTKDIEYRVVGIGDFNGDRRDDVLLRHLDGRWYYYPMNGRDFLDGERGSPRLTKSLDYGVAGIGDFNGDGRDDILLRHLDGRWYYYPMDGRQVLMDGRGSANLTKSLDYGVAGIGDFDGDGRDDVLLRNGEGIWYYYPMNGRRYISGAQGRARLTGNLDYSVAGIGDLNGDGRDDVLLRHLDGSWYYYPMNGRMPISTSQGSANLTTGLAWSVASLINRDPGGTISGTIAVTQGQILDGDTNDPNDPIEDNNTSASPQFVPIPASVAGYLRKEDDDWDFYKMSFPADVRISLVIADADDADLDLHLTEPDGTIIAESLGVDDLEVIDTTRTGEHLVAVSAYSGASNYSLVVSITGTASSTGEQATWSRDGEFVPNELIVRPRDVTQTDLVELLADQSDLRQSAPTPSGAVLTRLEHDATLAMFATGLDRPGLRYANAELHARATLLTVRKRLHGNDGIEYAQPNYVQRANAVPDDPHYYYQWHYPQIALPQAWDLTTGNDEVVTAVIDTGVATDHPDLADRLLRDSNGAVVGYDFISDPERAGDGDGIDPDPFDVGDSAVLGEASSFHGTHVAGTVGASTDNGVGVAGVTWLGKIMPIRVLGVDGGTDLDIAEGIRYAAGLPNASGSLPPVRADIMNLSLGPNNEYCRPMPPLGAVTRDALEDAINAGVVVVVSAGNDDCRYPVPMSTVDDVITVGATDLSGGRAPYSNFGSTVDVVAPGGNMATDLNGDAYPDGVFSTKADDSGDLLQHNYRFSTGTSMAAPHVAGVIALMLAANSDLTPDDINRLVAGAHADPNAERITWDRGAEGRDDDFGHGLIDAYRAVRVAQSIQGGRDDRPNEPLLSTSPTSLYFGATTDVLRVELRNVGTGTLTVSSIAADASWLSVSLEEWPKLVVRVDRTGLEDGTFVGNIAITSDGGNLTVPVTIQVQSVVLDANVGTVYVLALHPDTLETREFAITDVLSGYAFEMPTLPRGRYLVAAGTDRDGDGYICDTGEACGIWPLLDSPGVVDIGGDQTLKFGVSMDLFAAVTSQSVPTSSVSPKGFSIRPAKPESGVR